MEGKTSDKTKDQIGAKIFWANIEIVFILAVPAFLAVFLGLKLDSIYRTGRKITLIMVFAAFVFSWVLIIFKCRKLGKLIK